MNFGPENWSELNPFELGLIHFNLTRACSQSSFIDMMFRDEQQHNLATSSEIFDKLHDNGKNVDNNHLSSKLIKEYHWHFYHCHGGYERFRLMSRDCAVVHLMMWPILFKCRVNCIHYQKKLNLSKVESSIFSSNVYYVRFHHIFVFVENKTRDLFQ